MAPQIVIIPGAWHSPSHFSNLIAALGGHGFAVDIMTHRTLDHTGFSCTNDAKAVREQHLLPHIEAGRDVVLIAHSYGGGVGGIAAPGLSKLARQRQGKPGGIIGLIWISAFLMHKGTSMRTLGNGELAPWVRVENDLLIPSTPKETFYAECTPDDAEVAAKQIRPQSYDSIWMDTEMMPTWAEPEYDDRRAYLLCEKDQAIPPALQQMFIDGSQVKWDVRSINTDHSPFVSRVEETAEWIKEKVMEFARA